MGNDFSQSDTTAEFFSQLNMLLDTHRSATARLDRFLSTHFNVFDSIRPGELELTRIIGNLLSPVGTHGQGNAFLDSFLEQLSVGGVRRTRFKSAAIEKRTSYLASTRRIDLLIDLGESGIGIENKPLAGDQPDQVADYLTELQYRYPNRNYCLIYLTRDGREPSQLSIGAEQKRIESEAGRLKFMSYQRNIVPWLLSCVATCDSDKFRWFLRDFVDYINNYMPTEAYR